MFETWLENCLIPVLEPGQVVIVDNATFHHGGRIAQRLEAAGCRLLYLPPYSPDLNRIESCWAWLKSRIRQRLSHSASRRTDHRVCSPGCCVLTLLAIAISDEELKKLYFQTLAGD